MQTNLQSQQKQIPFNFLVQVQFKGSAVHALHKGIQKNYFASSVGQAVWTKLRESINKHYKI